jgi:hypothetical protein
MSVPPAYSRTPEPVWMTWSRENSLPYQDSNFDPSVVQPAASCYTDYAIPPPLTEKLEIKSIHVLPAENRYYSIHMKETANSWMPVALDSAVQHTFQFCVF